MGGIIQDLRYGLRTLLKHPGFAAVALLTLALGIGANTLIFSVVNAVLLRPLPFGEPERIVGLFTVNRVDGVRDIFSPRNFLDVAEQARALEAVAAYQYRGFDLSEEGEPQQLTAGRVSASFFRAMGASPRLGRGFLPEEDAPGSDRVVVLSHGLWQGRYGGDPEICGRGIQLNGEAHTVVGVMPRGFEFPRGAEIWAPLALNERTRALRGAVFLHVVGRLRQGGTLEEARAEMETLARRLEQDYPEDNAGLGIEPIPLHDQIVGDVRPALLVLSGAVAFVLLIGCANLANLTLIAATTRHRELAVRAALGASSWRLARQLLAENMTMSVLGGCLGLLAAQWGLSTLVALAPADLPRLTEVALDGRVLAFTFLLSLLTGLLFGAAPALRASRADVGSALKEGSRSAGGGPGWGRLRGALVVSQVALVLVLLTGAGLMIRSFVRLRSADPGFEPRRLLSLQLYLRHARYRPAEAKMAFHDALLAGVRSLPGVEAAAVASPAPLGVIPEVFDLSFWIDGRPAPPPGEEPVAYVYRVSPGYFQAVGTRLLRGRAFDDRDVADAPPVAIVSETMARRHWPDEDPVGQRIVLDQERRASIEIVGVVRDVKHLKLDAAVRPSFYMPYAQSPTVALNLIVRTSGPPLDLAGAIKARVWAVDKSLPADYLESGENLISISMAQPRFTTALLAGFAGLALALAVVGVYGVIAYSVARRTQEIGVRMALGAAPGEVFRMVLAEGMGLAGAGAALGLAASAALTRSLGGLLFEVSATDPPTFALVTLLLLAVALVAAWLPARRATRVDPMAALRCE